MKLHVHIALAAGLLFSSAANAQEIMSNFYAGIDYQYYGLDYKDQIVSTTPPVAVNGDQVFEDTLHGIHLHIGTKLTETFGIEAGFLWTGEGEKSIPGGFSTKFDVIGGTLDGIFYIPYKETPFNLLGLFGTSYSTIDIEITVPPITVQDDESEWGFRVGGGAQYAISDMMSIRALVIYQTVDMSGIASDAVLASVGLNFRL